MLIIGETLNAALPSVGQAVISRDRDLLTSLAHSQVEAGAQMLDVNAGGLAGHDEVADLVWMIETVQEAASVPLILDSSLPEALRAALAVYRGPRPFLSSMTGEAARVQGVLPLAVEHGTGVVALCMDENGIPATADGRLAIAEHLLESATAAGLQPEDLYFDPLVLAVSSDHRAGAVTLETLQAIVRRWPEVRTVCGMSNVGFGLPRRRLLNRTFGSMLVYCGLSAFILDVRDRALVSTLLAAQVLAGNDPWCRTYLRSHRAGKLEG